MQLHDIKSTSTQKSRKRVGRGGKRGTYSGRGQKGQKSRAGSSMRSDFRGGNAPVWKLFAKQRGSAKKVGIKHRYFKLKRIKPVTINLSNLNDKFKDGDVVTPKIMLRSGFIADMKNGVKVLSNGSLNKKLTFRGVLFSESAKKNAVKAGSTVK